MINLYEMPDILQDKMLDYHVLVIPVDVLEKESDEWFSMQVFYDKDFTTIHYEALKQMIEKEFPKTNQNV